MKILLDTHVWLWMIGAPSRLSIKARSVLLDPSAELWLSVASPWEIAIKHARGKIALPKPTEELVARSVEELGLQLLPIELHHALSAAALPAHHNDPFDRILLAQAKAGGMLIATADRIVAQYTELVLWVS